MLTSNMAIDGTPTSQLSKGSTKRVALVCDQCGEKGETNWNNYVQGQRKRGWTGETFCQPCAASRNGKLGRGKPNPAVSASNRKRSGDVHPSWKGGRYIDHHGYVMVSVRSGRNSGSGWENYRKEHVVVMEEHLGRPLKRNEVVHHIDGDKTNNSLENLWLTTRSGHRRAHLSLQGVSYLLLRSGVIEFNQTAGTYELTEGPPE